MPTLAAICLIAGQGIGVATPVMQESFNYPDGAIGERNGGSGNPPSDSWDGAWAASASVAARCGSSARQHLRGGDVEQSVRRTSDTHNA